MAGILRSALLAAIVAAVASGCATVKTTQAGAVGVERKQAMLVSSSEVNRAAAQQYAQVTGQAQQKGQVNRDPAQTSACARSRTA